MSVVTGKTFSLFAILSLHHQINSLPNLQISLLLSFPLCETILRAFAPLRDPYQREALLTTNHYICHL